ncbi:NAD(P)H-binding protein [Mucilaginibacter robiniae]|uniref:NAD(P)H-binding protein n=1 Tax=Mucilaginibacter robiniae TaxID=2728022 RepID=A0A7L5E5W0_9SPHI|nr:NAD(P)H-binding protein [Mucilaginibacter robiniae]QJD95736.1 NAD(P)H-binding protein [Mucilaginibacter robiniae]
MKITTTGSLGNVAKPLVKKLIAAGHEVTVITTQADRQAEIEVLGAKAAVGSISDATFLTEAFKGSDAVYIMMPPSIGSANFIQNIADAGEACAEAIKASGVTRAVMLSSVGADADSGTGPIQGTHRVEQILQKLDGVDVTVLRSGFFYINFLRDIPLIKSRGIFGNNYSGDVQLALTHPEDLSLSIAEELQAKGNGVKVKYIVSDISTGNQIAAMFGSAIGKPELTWASISDEQLKQGMLSAGLSPELVDLITEMGQGVRAGIVTRDFFAKGGKTVGHVKLEQFAEEFKTAYQISF